MRCEALATKAELFAVRAELKAEIAALREALQYKLDKTERPSIVEESVSKAEARLRLPVNQANATASNALVIAVGASALAGSLVSPIQQALALARQALAMIAPILARIAAILARLNALFAAVAALAA